MAKFQGSGFSIDVPDDCVDATSYMFVLPENNGYSANLSIRSESAVTVSDLTAHVNSMLDALKNSAPDFILMKQMAGKRGPNEGVMSQYEWGTGKSRVRQKQYCLMTPGKAARLYILTSTDLVINAAKSDPVFNAMMKKFMPAQQ
jgi:hypothetical protein